ncbi:MAG: rod shape-determining protein [Peptostreptococcaceae bacterium]
MTRADIGIDLGTANVMIYISKKGIVLDEPSVVSIDTRNKEVIAIGHDAKKMIGKTPGYIETIRPIRDGVISNFSATESMLKHFIERVLDKKGLGIYFMPRIMVCVPSGLTDIERRAVEQATKGAGAREVYIIEETIAAAVGAGVDISEANGRMIIDIGGGTTDIAVISLGGIVEFESLKIAGDKFDDEIVKYVKDKHNVLIGDKSAEKLKINIGKVYGDFYGEAMVGGRDVITRLPKGVNITSYEINKALDRSVNTIISTIRKVMDKTPPELISDIAETGIVLTGGGALLRGLAEKIEYNLKTQVIVPENPTTCVAKGTGETLNSLDLLKIAKGNK